MKTSIQLIIQIMVFILFFAPNVYADEQSDAMKETLQKIYIAGFILDEHGRGISEVDIIVEHKNRKIMSLRSMQGGWFEAARGLLVGKEGLKIRLVLLKAGYDYLTVVEKISSENHIFKFTIASLPGYLPPAIHEDVPTLPLYGFIENPNSNGVGLAGSKITLLDSHRAKLTEIKNKKIYDVAVSRDSGFFTINYEADLRNTNKKYRLTVDNPFYNEYSKTITLGDQDTPLIINQLSKRYFETAWFFRLGIYAPLKSSGKYYPITTHVNLVRLAELAFNYDFVKPTEGSEWSLYISNYNTEETDVGALMLGYSWKPYGLAQSSKYVADFAVGASEIEINKESRHIYKFPHIQFGISKYRENRYQSFAAPHYRLGASIYQDNEKWNTFIEFTFLGI